MTLKEALKVLLDDESIGDFIYEVRSRAVESGDGYKGESWDHPRVTRYSDALEALRTELERLS